MRAFPAFGALMVCVKVSKVAPVLVGPAQPTATVRATIANDSRQDFIAVAVRTQRTHFCRAARIGSRVVLMIPPLDPAPVHLPGSIIRYPGSTRSATAKGDRAPSTRSAGSILACSATLFAALSPVGAKRKPG